MKLKPLVCVFAHPDDEAFGPAGSIAHFASQRDVYIICVTSGDAASVKDKDSLAKIREKELLKSSEILGAKGVEFLRFTDGSLCNNVYHKLADKIIQKIEKYKPDTLLTFDLKGVSGHVDHVVVALVTSFIFQKLKYVKTLLYYCELKEMMEQIKDYFVYVPPGYNKQDIDLTIDVSKYWDTKLKAMRAHESQKDDADWIIGMISKFPKEEHFLKLEK